MQQKLLLITLLFTSALFTDAPNTDFTCNDKLLNFLEKQSKQQEKLLALQQQSNKLQDLQVQIAIDNFKKQEALTALKMAEANKPWYQEIWDNLAPNIQNAIIRLIIASITGKIINGAITTLDHITGDMLVAHGYDKWALYAGTFIVEESIQGYLKKVENKKVLANPEVQEYMSTLKSLNKEFGIDAAKGEIVIEGLNLHKKAKLAKATDEYLQRRAQAQTSQAQASQEDRSIQRWRATPNPTLRPFSNYQATQHKEKSDTDVEQAEISSTTATQGTTSNIQCSSKVRMAKGVRVTDVTEKEAYFPEQSPDSIKVF